MLQHLREGYTSTPQWKSVRYHLCPNACPLLCWGERSCNKLIKARCFPFSQGKNVVELLRHVLTGGEALSSSTACSLEWGEKKCQYPHTKIEFKKIKTPLSTVVVARNLHVMSSSIKKHHQKELVPVLY